MRDRGSLRQRHARVALPLWAALIGLAGPAPGQGAGGEALAGVPAAALARQPAPLPAGRTAAPVLRSIDLPLTFAANQGQLPESIRFLARHSDLEIALTSEGIGLRTMAPPHATASQATAFPAAASQDSATQASLFLRFENARVPSIPTGDGRLPGVLHFLDGPDPSSWTVGVATFRAVRYDQPWKGVDVVVRERGGRLDYDLVLAPGADAGGIRFRVEGAGTLRLAVDGSLLVETPAGTIRQPPPVTWEEDPEGRRHPLGCRFRILEDQMFGFEVDPAAEGCSVVIDPSIDYGSFLGGSFDDFPQAVAVDSKGKVYVAGMTWSPDFPSRSPLQPLLNGTGNRPRPTDAFVMKIDPAIAGGAGLIWATFLGGSAADAAVALAIDESTGNPRATIAGWTDSIDFPVTAAPHGPLGKRDAFVAILGPGGSTLDFSMELGGSGDDWIFMGAGGGSGGGLALGPVFAAPPPVGAGGGGGGGGGDGPGPQTCALLALTGMTTSSDFPTTSGAFDASFNGGTDIFAVTLDTAIPKVVYSTYVGGAGRDLATAITTTCDPNTQRFFLYIAGKTHSIAFPMPGSPLFQAFQPTFQGSALLPNGVFFILEPLAQGTNDLQYTTYLGTSVEVLGLGVDGSGTAYLAGSTGRSFPQQSGLVNTISPGGGGDGFLTLLSPAGTGPSDLVCSTILGGSAEDRCTAVLLDETRGWIYLAGRTASPSFPAVNAMQLWQAEPDLSGVPLSPVNPWERYDAFLTRFPLGSCASVDFSTFLGGQRTEEVFGMALDPAGKVWLTGPTHSSDFPITAGGMQTGFQGGLTDGFLVRIDPN